MLIVKIVLAIVTALTGIYIAVKPDKYGELIGFKADEKRVGRRYALS